MDKQPGLAPIKLKGEHNLRVAMQLKVKYSYVTDEIVKQNYVTY